MASGCPRVQPGVGASQLRPSGSELLGGEADKQSFLVMRWKEVVRGQDERTGRQAMPDDSQRATMTDMCPADLEQRLVFDSGRFETCPKVEAAIQDD